MSVFIKVSMREMKRMNGWDAKSLQPNIDIIYEPEYTYVSLTFILSPRAKGAKKTKMNRIGCHKR